MTMVVGKRCGGSWGDGSCDRVEIIARQDGFLVGLDELGVS